MADATQRRVRTPSVLQMEAVECGAACLAMILAFHGRWVPLEELRLACGVTRDGSNAANVLRAARRYGLGAKGFRKEPEGLFSLPVPSIVHWHFGHYVVFEGVRKGRVHLNDPAGGPRTVSRTEFDEGFTGVVLAFERGDAFAPGGQRPSALAALAARLSGSVPALLFLLATSVLLVLPGVLIAAGSRVFVDQVLVAELGSWLVPLVIGLCLTALLRLALTWLQQSVLLRLEAKLAAVMATGYLEKLLQLPATFFAQRSVGELSNRVTAATRIARLLSRELATTVLSVIAALFYGAVLFGYDAVIAIIVVALTLVNFVALRAVDRQRDLLSRRTLSEGGRVLGATVGAIQEIETLKSSGAENDAYARWAGYQANFLNAQQALGTQAALVGAVPALLAGLTTATVLGVGGLRVIEGAISLGALVAIQSLATSLNQPVQRLVDFAGRIQVIRADLARVSDTFAYDAGAPPAEEDASAAPPPAAEHAGLVVRGLTFGYSPLAAPLVEDFELDLRPGARVALVGGSGSGKSTIGRLLVGLYRPWNGRIDFEGRPLAELPPEEFAQRVGYVDQSVFLFEGTIRDNLTLWNPEVDDSVLRAALRDADLLDMLERREGGLDAGVSEGGLDFSGGQRQRLEIARALVADPELLVLDEATAALDPATEKRIDDNLRCRGCACVIIAHRLSTIRDADEIVVLRRGRVVERGTHESLLAAGGEYASLLGTLEA